MTSQSAGIKSSSKFFRVALFFLSLLVTGPRFMPVQLLVLELWQLLFIRDWLEIQKSEKPVLVLPNIWRLGGVKDTKFRKNFSNEQLLNAAKSQGYSFYRF